MLWLCMLHTQQNVTACKMYNISNRACSCWIAFISYFSQSCWSLERKMNNSDFQTFQVIFLRISFRYYHCTVTVDWGSLYTGKLFYKCLWTLAFVAQQNYHCVNANTLIWSHHLVFEPSLAMLLWAHNKKTACLKSYHLKISLAKPKYCLLTTFNEN